MKRVVKWIGFIVFDLVVLAAVVVGVAYSRSNAAMARKITVADAPVAIDGSAEQVERGRYLAATRGCLDCHGPDLGGHAIIDAAPIGRIVGPNLTPGGLGPRLSAVSIEHAVRHGVGHDGRPLVFMPAPDWALLSDDDVAAIAAYVKSVPAVTTQPPALIVGPLARVLWMFNNFPLLPADRIPHDVVSRSAPPKAVTADYGKYVMQMCVTCHGEGFSGGHVPGTPPEFKDAANITRDPTGIATWTVDDFKRALRSGKRPDGSAIDEFMPWKALAQMDDVEIEAMWAYLQTVPARPKGTR
jgi:mono/diheme cytochrome c family protein